MHEPYEITTTALETGPAFRPAYLPDPSRPPMAPREIPPGVELVTLPDGRRTLAYTHPTPVPVITTAPGAAGPGVRPVPAWARTTALLAPTVGGGIAAAGIGISYAAPGLTAMTNALWAAAALIATGTAGAIALRTGRPRATGRGTTHITQQITATGLFGRATGTINHR